MSILTEMAKCLKNKILTVAWVCGLLAMLGACQPQQDVELRQIRDVIVDASAEPLLKANAILYNPNNVRMKLRHINIEVFVNDKSSALIDQKLDMRIPAKAEFTIPLEVRLNTKEKGFLNTLFKVISGKKTKVRYKGSIRITYKGIPVRVPVDYEDEVKLKF
jgi:LEA14-like dessication related protein